MTITDHLKAYVEQAGLVPGTMDYYLAENAFWFAAASVFNEILSVTNKPKLISSYVLREQLEAMRGEIEGGAKKAVIDAFLSRFKTQGEENDEIEQRPDGNP